MKTLILSVRDTGGTGYTLAHAINKYHPQDPAVNLRGMNTYINYPCLIDMGNYSRSAVRNMVNKADVLVFLGAMKPFFEALNLKKKDLKDKKKILLCMGSEWRWGRKQLLAQADKLLENYKVVLGGADMFIAIDFIRPKPGEIMPVFDPEMWGKQPTVAPGDLIHFDAVKDSEAEYLPVVRSFEEIERTYGLCNQDRHAINSFAEPKKRVVFAHAPTSEANKGTETFYRAITLATQRCPTVALTTIRQHPWVSCLQLLSQCDVLLDQVPPFPTAYGALSVEAAILKMPSFSQVSVECQEWIKRKTGLTTPFITFKDDQDLYEKIVRISEDHQLRRELGQMSYDYCKQLHDEKPVVDRFFKIVDSID